MTLQECEKTDEILGPVGSIDLHIINGKVRGEDQELTFSLMEVNGDSEGFLLENLGGSFFQQSPSPHSVFHNRNLIKEEIDTTGIDLGP